MDHPEPERDPLELLAEEFTHRLRHGDQPSVEECEASHPDLAEQIRATFPGLVMIEELASQEYSARKTNVGGLTVLTPLQVERIADFRIVARSVEVAWECLRGPAGVVGRRLALKVLPAPQGADRTRLARFSAKRRPPRSPSHQHRPGLRRGLRAGPLLLRDAVH